eukprot:1311054-Amorphochlora_amoeboformis.AAC.1
MGCIGQSRRGASWTVKTRGVLDSQDVSCLDSKTWGVLTVKTWCVLTLKTWGVLRVKTGMY